MKFSSVPAYTFGSKTIYQLPPSNTLAPGPGTYELRSDNIVVPAAVFSSADRTELFKNKDLTPGPNEYQTEIIKKSKSQTLYKPTYSKEKADKDKNKMISPGPGSYNPNKSSVAVSYSMGNKVYAIGSDKAEPDIGPGHYNPSYNCIQISKSSKFGSSQRNFKYDTDTPGPGTYQLPITKALTTRFGLSERSQARDKNYPGPGEYNIPGTLGGTSKSISSRRPIPNSKDVIPGPGAYYPGNTKLSEGTKASISGRRQEKKINENPGPGSYNPSIDYTKGVKATTTIGTASRWKETKDDDKVPGPGHYEPSYKTNTKANEGPKVSILGRRQERKIDDNPGPGAYDPSIDCTRSMKTMPVIGTATRWNEIKTNRNRVPGPGDYDPVYKPPLPAWTFTKDPKVKIVDDDQPAPGHYDIPPSLPDVPKYLMLSNNLNL